MSEQDPLFRLGDIVELKTDRIRVYRNWLADILLTISYVDPEGVYIKFVELPENMYMPENFKLVFRF